jgi:anti-sigma factor RsiW
MNGFEHVDESELHAFVDGELDADSRRRVEDYLHRHGEDAALVEGWRRQNAALRAAFAQVVKEPMPATLRPSAKRASFGSGVNWARFSPSKASSLRAMRRSDTTRRIARRPAVASILTLLAATLVAGVALLVFTGPATPPERARPALGGGSFVERAEIAYLTFAPDARAAEIAADRKADLSAWLAERVGHGGVPDLSATGLELIGGRLVPGAFGPAGLIFYRATASGSRVALYFERAGAARPPSEAPRTLPGLVAVEWRGLGFAFVLLGPLTQEAAEAAAERAASQPAR